MKINLLAYKNNLPLLKAYRQANSNLSLSDLITTYAVSTHVPLIVCAYYMARIDGMTPELTETIKRINQFYKYDEIIGVDELMKLQI